MKTILYFIGLKIAEILVAILIMLAIALVLTFIGYISTEIVNYHAKAHSELFVTGTLVICIIILLLGTGYLVIFPAIELWFSKNWKIAKRLANK